MPKGSLTTQYIGGIVADQLSNMAATIIGSKRCQRVLITIMRKPPFCICENKGANQL